MGHGGGTPGDGERPDMSDENGGQMPGDGERPDMPDGDGGQMPEMVTGRMAVLEHRHG